MRGTTERRTGLTAQFGDSTSRSIAAPIEDVWTVASDLAMIGSWSPECYAVQWLDGHCGPGRGVRFRGLNRIGPIHWSTTCTIDEWSPPHRLSYLAQHVTGAVTRWTYDLTEHVNGTLVTESFQTVDSPGFVMIADRIARRATRLRLGMDQTLAAMARAVLAADA